MVRNPWGRSVFLGLIAWLSCDNFLADLARRVWYAGSRRRLGLAFQVHSFDGTVDMKDDLRSKGFMLPSIRMRIAHLSQMILGSNRLYLAFVIAMLATATIVRVIDPFS